MQKVVWAQRVGYSHTDISVKMYPRASSYQFTISMMNCITPDHNFCELGSSAAPFHYPGFLVLYTKIYPDWMSLLAKPFIYLASWGVT